jgi:hypothetical protein
MFQTFLNGYEYCLKSKSKELREEKAERFKKRLGLSYPLFKVCQAFAHNAHALSIARDSEQRLSDLLGPPSLKDRTMAKILTARVAAFKALRSLRKGSLRPRTYPCKRYTYDGRPDPMGRPFRAEYDHPDIGFLIQRALINLFSRDKE